ncbi:HAMP domain-containing protein, partial [Pseudoroseomonas wenyumeiae]
RSLALPIEKLAAAARRFGTDPQAPPIPAAGPSELRDTIEAFNAMQARIGRFVQDRTVMLAAISHDLRTPLTRMRLLAEFVDEPQQEKMFRYVDEMQEMIDSALAFFRDDASQEPFTRFDLPQLLNSIIDDYGDQG